MSQDLAFNIHSFKNKDFHHITNSDHTLLQTKIYNESIINSSKKAELNRRKPRTIFDFQKMDQEHWIKYTQEVEKELNTLKVYEKIIEAQEENNINNINADSNKLQEIWNLIEKSIIKIGKKLFRLRK
jgi:hypothetical protein